MTTKGELLKLLEPYDDDQYVYVNCHSADFPNGSQVLIQGVQTRPPWHSEEPDRSNWLIGILVHARNSLLSVEESDAAAVPTQHNVGT